MLQLRWGAKSIVGNFRENNEDRFLADPQGRYFLVADGMGGQAAGEKASELAVGIVPEQLESRVDFDTEDHTEIGEAIKAAVSHTNGEIMTLGEVDPRFHNMGTTLVFLVQAGDDFYAGGVGDSRAYRLRQTKLEQLTTDHSLTQALVDAGTISTADAATHRYRNVLYRYLGTKEGSGDIEIKKLSPKSGDRYILCSDGVTDGLPDAELCRLLSEQEDPQSAADALVDAALAAGSRDNITCLVVNVD